MTISRVYRQRPLNHNFTTGLIQLCDEILSPNTVMVEIGSHHGESAAIFLESGKVKSITCVDPLDDIHAPDVKSHPAHSDTNWEVCQQEILAVLSNSPDSRFIRLPSIEVAQNWPDASLDFVYIDGFHEYDSVLADIKAWLPKIKSSGIMAGHDYIGFPGVKQAVDELFGKPDKVYLDTSWVHRLTPASSIGKMLP